EGDVFEGLRKRLRGGKGTIRKRKSDYLTYAIIDAIVDMYFTIMEQIGADIESLQDRIMDNPKPESVQSLHLLRQDVILLKKSVWPLRELVNNFQRIES
ncbi:MAG: magnesium and cobalt transport protein CorA, partial [Candidatus Korarchaeota archaeon]|nr:magnesium and cobalt transport protein CorA [Candidatus Korarchaeota archaeon]